MNIYTYVYKRIYVYKCMYQNINKHETKSLDRNNSVNLMIIGNVCNHFEWHWNDFLSSFTLKQITHVQGCSQLHSILFSFQALSTPW